MKIYIKLTIIIFSIVTVIMTVFGFISYKQQERQLYKTLIDYEGQVTRRLENSLVDPLWNINAKVMDTILTLEMENEFVLAIVVDDNFEKSGKLKSGPDEIIDYDDGAAEKILPSAYNTSIGTIVSDDESIGEIGTVTIYTTNALVKASLRARTGGLIIQILALDFLIVFALIFSFIILVRKPLSRIGNSIHTIALGEGDLTQKIVFKHKDEVGELAFWFNIFIEKLNDIISNVKTVSSKNMEIKEVLNEKSRDSIAALNQITTNVKNIRDHSETLEKRIETSDDVLKKNNNRLLKLDENVSDEITAVEETSASINEMVASLQNVSSITKKRLSGINELKKSAEIGGTKLENTVSIVDKIYGNIGNISEMVELINNISSQTNLLAMNAAIEAVYAGDSGKGFAVVADEIRKLAESSNESAKGITNILHGIIDDIKLASSESEDTNKTFKEINRSIDEIYNSLLEISASTEELSNGSQEISKSTTILHEISRDLRNATDELKTNNDTVNTSMIEVRHIGSEVFTGMDEISEGVRLISSIINELSKISENLNETSNSIQEEVSRFRTA